MSNLIICEHNNASLSSATKAVATAAAKIGGQTDILIIGHQCAGVAQEAAMLSGINKVIVADDASFKDHIAEALAPQILSSAQGYSHLISSATTFGKDIMPRVAALLDVMIISDVIDVVSEDTFVRPTYAGNIITEVKSSDSVKVITFRPTSFEAAQEGNSAEISNCEVVATDAGIELIEVTESGGERPELSTAKIVVSGGRGIGSAENFAMITKLADKLGAAVGASRAAVDAGFVPNDFQVGQTGKVVAPDLYIAVGISGAIQHLAGMKDSKYIVAINKDPDAPIFQVADYGLVGDLHTILPEIESELAKAGIGS